MANPQKENGYTAIANEILEAFGKFRIPGEARQMLDIIIRKTYGYGKKDDCISTSQFIELTGLSRGMIHRARRRLLYANLITVCKKVHSKCLSYSFIKDYDKWKVYAKKDTVCKKVTRGMQKGARSVSNNETHKRKKEIYTKEIYICMSFLSYYNEKTKKHFRPTKSNLDLINSRLKDGFTLEQLKAAVDNFVKDDWVDRHKYMDLIYCIGKQRGKPDNLERWLNWKAVEEKTGIDKWEVRR